MDVAISGASGLIGTALVRALKENGHRPIRLVRQGAASGEDEIRWDPAKGEIDADSLDGIDAIVNFSGAGIGDKRWTPEYKELLVSSRTRSTALLAETCAALPSPPTAFLSSSAIGYYGDRGAAELNEQSEPGSGFLPDLVQDWERSAQPAIDAGIRTCLLRTGIVMSTEGGALPKLLPLFKLGAGGKFGRGDQYMSWISIVDMVGGILHLLSSEVSGPVNMTAPAPVTSAEFAGVLGRVLGRPSFLPVPAFGPRLLLGSDRADALLFDGAKVLPTVLEESAFDFKHPKLEVALRAILAKAD